MAGGMGGGEKKRGRGEGVNKSSQFLPSAVLKRNSSPSLQNMSQTRLARSSGNDLAYSVNILHEETRALISIEAISIVHDRGRGGWRSAFLITTQEPPFVTTCIKCPENYPSSRNKGEVAFKSWRFRIHDHSNNVTTAAGLRPLCIIITVFSRAGRKTAAGQAW